MQAAIGVLSLGTISTLINSVSTLSINIYSLSNSIKLSKNTYHSDIIDLLIKTDLESTIKLLDTIITEIPHFYNSSMSILISLKNVQEIIIQIEGILKSIHDKTDYNNKILLLKNFRSYTFSNELKNLEILIQVLEKRKDNLFKTLEVFKHCERKNEISPTQLLLHSNLSSDTVIVNEI
jgi:hypothetical protein